MSHPENKPETTHTELVCVKCQATADAAPETENPLEANFKEKFLRTVADFENFKHRIEKERMLWALEAKANLLKIILPIVDDLERAAANLPQETQSATALAWQNGIIGVAKNLALNWQNIGLKEIDCAGAFDPERHEALCQVPNTNFASGQVVEVLRKGYTLNGIVIRYAQVTVAT